MTPSAAADPVSRYTRNERDAIWNQSPVSDTNDAAHTRRKLRSANAARGWAAFGDASDGEALATTWLSNGSPPEVAGYELELGSSVQGLTGRALNRRT